MTERRRARNSTAHRIGQDSGDIGFDRLRRGDVVGTARIAFLQLGGAATVKRRGTLSVELHCHVVVGDRLIDLPLAEIDEGAALECACVLRSDIDRRAVVLDRSRGIAFAEIDAPAVEIGDGRFRIQRDRAIEVVQRIREVTTARIGEPAGDITPGSIRLSSTTRLLSSSARS